MYFAKDYLRTLFLRLPLEMKPPFYVVIRAKRRSSRSLGKGSNFISQIFLIKTLTTGPAPGMNYTHYLSLCSQTRYQLSLSCCRGLVFFFTTWFQVDGQQLCLDRNLLRHWIMCQFTHFIHGRRAHGSVKLDPFMTLQRLEFKQPDKRFSQSFELVDDFHWNKRKLLRICEVTFISHKYRILDLYFDKSQVLLKGTWQLFSFSILLGAGERSKAGLQV